MQIGAENATVLYRTGGGGSVDDVSNGIATGLATLRPHITLLFRKKKKVKNINENLH